MTGDEWAAQEYRAMLGTTTHTTTTHEFEDFE